MKWESVCQTTSTFLFNLRTESIENLFKLYRTAIECATRATGWVIMSTCCHAHRTACAVPTWYYYKNNIRTTENEGGHATAVYFFRNRQTFFDPSSAMQAIRVSATSPETVYDYMRNNHMWIPQDQNPILSIVDDRSNLCNIQSRFASPDPSDPQQLRGCCSTIVILVVYSCLRFGCRNPQWMVDALRCGMDGFHRVRDLSADPYARHTFQAFLLRLQSWQSNIADQSVPWGENGFLELLKLWSGPKRVACDHMEYADDETIVHTRFCKEESEPP